MAVAFVQSDKNFTHSGSTCAKAFASNNVAGNMLVVSVGVWKSGSFADPTISDTRGNTWVLVLSTPRQFASGQSQSYLFVAYNCAAGANTITVSVGSSSDIDIVIHEYSGCAIVTALDQIACGALHGVGSSGSILAGTFQTQFANEVIFSFAYDQSHGTQTYTPSAGWTSRQQTNNTGGESLVSYDQIVSSTGSYTNTITISTGLSNGLHAIIVGFADTSTADPLIQSGRNSASASSSLTVAFPSNNVLGNLLMLAIGRFVSTTLGTITSVTDSQGNTWSLIGQTTIASTGGHGQSQAHLYACASCAAGANTITVATSSAQDLQLIAAEYSANVISTAVENSTSAGVTTIASGNLPVDPGLAFTVAYNQSDNEGLYSDVNGTGWRLRVSQGDSGLTALSVFDQVPSSSSTLEQTITSPSSSFGLHVIVSGKVQSVSQIMQFLVA